MNANVRFAIFVKYGRKKTGEPLVKQGYTGGIVRGLRVGVYDTIEEARDQVERQFNAGDQIAWYLPCGSDLAKTELHLGAVMNSEDHAFLERNNKNYQTPRGRAWKRRNRGIQKRQVRSL